MLEKRYNLAIAIADNVSLSYTFRAATQAQTTLPNIKPQIDRTTKMIDRLENRVVASAAAMMHVAYFLRQFGLLNDDAARLMEAVYRAVMINYAIWLLYEGITALANAKAAFETAQAAIETAAHVLVLDFVNIALAVSMAAIVYSSFQFISGSWKLPNFDHADASARRQGLTKARRGMEVSG